MDIYNLISFGGLLAMVGMAWLASANRRRVSWRCAAAGVGLQLALGALVFLAPGSRQAFGALNDAVVAVLTAAGSKLDIVFGPLALGPGESRPGVGTSVGFILALQALPLAIVFAALMGLLYYCGVMQRVIRGFAWLFARLMKTSGAESLCAASNIFVGVESATTVRPYLAAMTRSELCTVLTAGMATIASTVLAAYVGMLHARFPDIAGHLISASIMSAPAAIVTSKLLLPETGDPATLARTVEIHYERESSAIESVINGAMAGVKLVVGIVALLVAVLGLLAILNLVIAQVGYLFGAEDAWSLERLLGYVMRPFAYLIGIPVADAPRASELLGERLVFSELPAYLHLNDWLASGEMAHERTRVVLAYALCGFAHVASLGIFIGGIAALVPERRKDLASVGPRALAAAVLACLMTGAVAGIFYHAAEAAIQAAPAVTP